MDTTLQDPPVIAAKSSPTATIVGYWIATALIAHLSVGDGPKAWGWAAGTGVFWALSYVFWRRGQSSGAPVNHSRAPSIGPTFVSGR